MQKCPDFKAETGICAWSSPNATPDPDITDTRPPTRAAHRPWRGPEILKECRRLRDTTHPDGLAAGDAVATTAGRMPAAWVIHTVGPVYSTNEDRSPILASCYRRCLEVAEEQNASSIAFPAVSAGVYGWPMNGAAEIAVRVTRESSTTLGEVRFVLFNREAYEAFARALG